MLGNQKKSYKVTNQSSNILISGDIILSDSNLESFIGDISLGGTICGKFSYTVNDRISVNCELSKDAENFQDEFFTLLVDSVTEIQQQVQQE